MNPSRLLDGHSRSMCRVAGALTVWLMAGVVSAQGYVPQQYFASPGASYASPATQGYGPYAAPAYYQQAGLPQTAVPAGYRIPMMTTRPHSGYPYCPPGQQPGYMPYPQHQQQPGVSPAQPGQSQPGTSEAPSPGAQPTDQTPSQNQQTPQTQSQQPQNESQNPTTPTDFTPSPEGSGRASMTPGMNTPQLGRNDQSNRLNLFDNMAAAPQSRVWFGVQYANNFDTGLQLTDGFKSFIASQNALRAYLGQPLLDTNDVLRRNQDVTTEFFQYSQRLYRVGGEWAPKDYFSIAVQGQYYSTNGGFPDAPPDEWTNPQIMAKLVLARDCDTVFSATLGVTPETENEFGEIDEGITKIYPGMLFYEGITQNLFAQGGVQAGIPIKGSNEIYTADWSLALGYWLYRDLNPCGPGCHDRPHFLRKFKVTGIVPQINVLGKHVVGNNKIVGPFGFDSFASHVIIDETTATYELCDPVTHLPVGLPPITVTTPVAVPYVLPEGFVIYREPREVIDMTVGGQVLFGNHVQVGVGYSFPLTDSAVRDSEFTGYVTYAF